MTQPREPGYISGAEFIEPPPEIAAHFSESFAQARARVAREKAETESLVSNMETSEAGEALEDNPACPICGTTLQEVLYGMPTAEAAHSGKYLIMGCTIMDDSPSEKWFCPKCEAFVDEGVVAG